MTNGQNSAAAETGQISTGVPGMDQVLNGGLRRRGLHVLLGTPGTGKSVIAHQIGAHLIREGGKVLYLTVLVETHQMLMEQARTFAFYDPAAVPSSLYYASLYPALASGGLTAVRDEIGRLVAQRGATLVIIDGVHALKMSAASPVEYQRFMHELEAQASITGITTLLLAHPEGEIAADPTFTIADAIFQLRTEDVGLWSLRMFKVEKLRGVDHVRGWHTFDITPSGAHIYPRLESLTPRRQKHVLFDAPPARPLERNSGFAVAGLDDMLGGGLERESSTLVVGTPGSGKTLMGLAFLSAGAEQGEKGMFLGFHEHPETLLDKADAVALSLRKAVERRDVRIHWVDPNELNADALAEQVLNLVEEHGIERLAIDSVESVRAGVFPPSRDVAFHIALTRLLRERGVNVLLLMDLPRVAGFDYVLPMSDLSTVIENTILLRYVEYRGEVQRLITILKARARRHDHTLRQLQISDTGLALGKTFELEMTGYSLSR